MKMKCIVTGAAGFIGSHLCERLIQLGHDVVGIDAFLPYYSPKIKETNLQSLSQQNRFELHRLDLRTDELQLPLSDAEYIFHLAAMPGLTASWTHFDDYMTCNLLATQRLLEAIPRSAPKLQRFILGSTSSVYGKYASGDSAIPTRPFSPYGVTKLAAEHLARAVAENYGLPLVVLRLFSVYGPRQRPDMAYHKFIHALLSDQMITVTGDGRQVRGNTYVYDCVAALVAAMKAPPFEIYNIGGGEAANVWDIIERLEAIAHRKAVIKQVAARPGDQLYTMADTSRFNLHTGWLPQTSLAEGLSQQFLWQLRHLESDQAGIRQAA
jgi:nucleoside-diphosphate-sugar epimerase